MVFANIAICSVVMNVSGRKGGGRRGWEGGRRRVEQNGLEEVEEGGKRGIVGKGMAYL